MKEEKAFNGIFKSDIYDAMMDNAETWYVSDHGYAVLISYGYREV